MLKRTFSLLLALMLVIGFLPVTAQAGALDNGLQYKVYADHVEITRCTDSDAVVVIPALIEGLPVTAIADDAFMYHPTLTSVELPDTLTSIGEDAFFCCDRLTSIEIPAGVTYIGDGAFHSCDRLTGIHVDKNNPNYTSDDRGVFFDKNKIKLIQAPGALAGTYTIPDSVTTICDYAFKYCRKLCGIEFPDSLTRIGMDAFEDCDITSAVFPDGLTYIGRLAFKYCDKLTSVYIPDSVTYIGDEAFKSCKQLTSITIPDSVTYLGRAALSGCSSLTGIHVDKNNPNYCSDDRGVVYDKNKTTLIQAPGGLTGSYTIPDGITCINDYAFYYCTSLNSLEIPNTVTQIRHEAFGFCEGLTTLDLPDGITVISDYALYGCIGLTGIEIPDGVTHIGHMSFSACNSINSIDIPASVTYIDDYAFAACFGPHLGLGSVRFEGDAPTIDYYAFQNSWLTFYYPEGNPTWTENVMQGYGATVFSWEPYTPHVHEYAAAVTAPTCVKRGYTTYTCPCGKSYISDYVDALGHEYIDGICVRCGAAEPMENPFTDVPAGSFYEAPVLWALENGITTGATETTFNPGGQCLRAQVVTFLHRAAENPEPTAINNPFTDVKPTDFFYKPVLWAVEEGITNGISATEFGSYAVCNRAAVVTFLWRAAGSPEPTSTANPFTDVKTSDFFYKPVLWAIENGITNGVSATEFGPTADCNRAQVVTFLYRAYS